MACKDQSPAEPHHLIWDAEDQCIMHACHQVISVSPLLPWDAYIKYLDDMHVVE